MIGVVLSLQKIKLGKRVIFKKSVFISLTPQTS